MFRVIALTCILLFVGCCIGLTCLTSGCALGSLVRTRCTHVGLRVHGDAVTEWVGTAQISTDAPVCREVYP